jgi:NAD-dependent protein deacetylase/lipoamidase
MTINDLEQRIQTLAQWIHAAQHLVVFTGAGISTESGLPDFRGPDGLWTRRDKGLAPPPQTKPWDQVQPNSGHLAITELQELGKLKFLISQNVDNLHIKSGIRPELLAELHGNTAKLRCRRCGRTVGRATGLKTCTCGGSLTSSVVDFGQSLPQRDLELAFEHAARSDLFVVVGSSLVVTPAANMPVEALRAGAKLVIINQGQTPLDPHAHLRFSENITQVLPRAVRRLKRLMGFFEL